MKALKVVRSLGPIDIKSILRDSLLQWMVFIPILFALIIHWGVPFLNSRLLTQFQFDLTPYYPLIMSFLLLITPLMTGMVIGFLLLDQRDDHTLTALQVTPLTLNSYLIYRTTIPIILSVIVNMIIFPIAGLIKVNVIHLFISSLLAAPLAPMSALALACFAENKVQGFALMKVSGFVIYPPLIAYFLPTGWQLLFGVIPTFWPLKLFWLFHAGSPYYWPYLLMGIIYQLVILMVLSWLFNLAMTRDLSGIVTIILAFIKDILSWRTTGRL